MLCYSKLSINIKFIKFTIVKDIIKFGRYIIGHSLIVIFKNQYDNMMVAKFLTTGFLGLYSWAFTIATIPVQMLVCILNSVMYPIYCKMQDKDEMLKLLYQTWKIVLVIVLPVMIILFCYTRSIVFLAAGEKWLPMCLTLKILCVYSSIRCFLAVLGPVFTAIGKPNIIFYIGTLTLIIGVALVPIFIIKIGMPGAAIAITVTMLLDFILVMVALTKEFPKAWIHNKKLYPIILVNLSVFIFFIIINFLLKPNLLFQILIVLIGFTFYGWLIYKIENEK